MVLTDPSYVADGSGQRDSSQGPVMFTGHCCAYLYLGKQPRGLDNVSWPVRYGIERGGGLHTWARGNQWKPPSSPGPYTTYE
jgi:hypothetical protein